MTQIRLKIIQILIPVLAILIVVRLFYWQVVRADFLTSRASSQHNQVVTLTAMRGEVLAADHSILVGTTENFMLFAYKPQLDRNETEVSRLLAPILAPVAVASESADLASLQRQITTETEDFLRQRLTQDRSWVSLKHYLSRAQKEAVESLNIKGLGFEPELVRFYPESSMSAQLLGFVGQDINGQPTGYFGLEGYYNRQLQGQEGKVEQEMDAHGNPILVGNYSGFESKDGRNLVTTINRAVQYQAEKSLKAGMDKYGAVAGSVIVMETQTGAIIAMASFPNYFPGSFYEFPSEYHKNPVVANLFEPGSIFKPLVMAAAIDAGAVTPETRCDICAGQINIGTFTVGTWNGEYYPDTTMTETIIHSDNTGMVFTARKLGKERLREYLEAYGIGQKTGIDLQEETTGVLRPVTDWKEIDLATIAFGQGIAVTPIQVAAALNTLGNDGVWVQPYLVSSIRDGQRSINTTPSQKRRVVSSQTATAIRQIMVEAVSQGEAKWAKPKHLSVAGKTGTAQIPVAGHYDEEKTIASFIGFSPADKPKFTMLVSLREPQTSQWGSETAAPLWFEIAKQISLLL